MKTMIAIPCFDSMNVNFVRSLINIEAVGDISINFAESSMVYASRNNLAAAGLDSDYILWLDSDMIFPPDTLKRLIAADENIITGLCFMRRPPFRPAIFKTIRMGLTIEDSFSEPYLDYPEGLFEVDACGAACMLVKTEVFKKIFETGQSPFTPIPGYGEDISFCIRAKQLGYKIWCDSRIKIGHIAQTMIDEATYQGYKKIKKD